MTEACPHDDLEFSCRVSAPELGVAGGFWLARVYIRCVACGQQFSWRGLASGDPNPELPCVSADGYELRAPLQPKAGAVVGLLESVGIADRLVQPEDSE